MFNNRWNGKDEDLTKKEREDLKKEMEEGVKYFRENPKAKENFDELISELAEWIQKEEKENTHGKS